MEAHYRAFNGKLVIKVEGSTIKDLFEQIGPVAEVLDGDDCCGKCQSPHIFPRARDARKKDDGKQVTYYELVCSDCGAKLSFGQHSEGGTLWAKRTDDQGNALDHRGWKVYLGLPAPEKTNPQPIRPSAPSRPSARPGAAPEDPRLSDLLARCTSIRETSLVHGELISAIEGLETLAVADQAWAEALKRHGDPAYKTAAVRPVTEYLLNVLKTAEQKKGAA